jgi:DNA-binding response OmpR family regulator
VVEVVTTARELVDSFAADPAAVVLIDEESSSLAAADLVHALRAAQGGGGALPGILVISRDWQAQRPALATLGVRDVLPKPLVVQMLSQAVERIMMRRSRPADSGT